MVKKRLLCALLFFSFQALCARGQPDKENTFEIVRGEKIFISNPIGFESTVWASSFTTLEGNPIKNVGSYSIKKELQVNESDGNRTEGITSVQHLADIDITPQGVYVQGKEKGIISVSATDNNQNKKAWKVVIRYINDSELPKVSKRDYKKLREKWTALLIGEDINVSDPISVGAINKINTDAQKAWNSYAYKGKALCKTAPWQEDLGVLGNPDIPYQDDATEFRPAFTKLYALAVAYSFKYGEYYKNKTLLNDITNILDYLIANCYTPKAQTDNWWTWEIGIPRSLVPTLVLLADDLTMEQKQRYMTPIVFFQPDPYHGGAINSASTHAVGYRVQYAANRVDCAMTSLGIGLVLEDNEAVYLAKEASASTISLQTIEDSNLLSENGFPSGYYADGSYIDHSRIPYTNSYGVVVIEGLSKMASILSNSPWQYGAEKTKILKIIMEESYGLSVYNGYALDMLRGRAIARNNTTDKSIGRNIITYTLLLLDALDSQTQAVMKNYIKSWLIHDTEYIHSVTRVAQLKIRADAQNILDDPAILGIIEPVHRNFPLMDRVIHRNRDWLFGVSMYSSRIFNSEIMNGENLYGWHQGDGMTFLYTQEKNYYTKGFWNTINPFRLPGTTTVSKNIGNGNKDSSGFYQQGDYTSKEDWVGGSSLQNFGTNGMALSGDINSDMIYAPHLKAYKSYFMLGDEIVCLGTGIDDKNSTFVVETTIENYKLHQDASNTIIIDGLAWNMDLKQVDVAKIVATEGQGTGDASVDGEQLIHVTWIWLEGTAKNSSIGWYFPQQDQNIFARKVASTGSWNTIGNKQPIDTEVTNFFELWVNHGINPTQKSYAYVLLPGKTENEIKAYAENPSIQILANTNAVQAVYNKEYGVSGFNFWKNEKHTVGEVSSWQQSSITMKESENGILEIAVSDPTMKNNESIELEIKRDAVTVLEQDSNVFVTIENDRVKIRILTSGTNGNSSYAKIQLAK